MDLITSQLLRRAVPLFTALASVLLLLAIAALLTLGKDVFIPLALATLLSFALAPLVLRFQRVGLGRGLSVVGAVLLALFAFGAIGYVVASQLADLAADLPSYRSTIQRNRGSRNARGDRPLCLASAKALGDDGDRLSVRDLHARPA